MEQPIFTSMGMFIIDENQFPDAKDNQYDIVGGGGPYAIVGARIVGGADVGSRITGIIDKGSDFPEEVGTEINSWGTNVIFRSDPNRLTTRGINIYDEHENRDFKYKTSKKRIEVLDVISSDYLKHSKCFHLICSIDRCKEFTTALKDQNPLFIYEPLPDACVPENFDKLKDALESIDIFTPNLQEAASLANVSVPKTEEELSQLSGKLASQLSKADSGVVLRCGPDGCHIRNSTETFNLPAYHTDKSQVVDVTGGGNSFCGGFGIGFYLSQRDWKIAGVCGNVASGCVIEHLGMPKVSDNKWNGKSSKDRFKHYIVNNLMDINVNWL